MYLKFTQFSPSNTTERFVRVKSETITSWFQKRVGDLYCVCIYSAGEAFDVSDDFEEVSKMILDAYEEELVRDRQGR